MVDIRRGVFGINSPVVKLIGTVYKQVILLWRIPAPSSILSDYVAPISVMHKYQMLSMLCVALCVY